MKEKKVPRITKRYLTNWLNDKFKSLEMDFAVVSFDRSYNRGGDIEAGACRFIITINHNSSVNYNTTHMYLMYSFDEIKRVLEKGGRLYIDMNNKWTITGAQIGLKSF